MAYDHFTTEYKYATVANVSKKKPLILKIPKN